MTTFFWSSSKKCLEVSDTDIIKYEIAGLPSAGPPVQLFGERFDFRGSA